MWDLSTPPSDASSLPEGVEPNSVDIAILIFVLSALHPQEWQRAVANVYKMLKPGGMAFIRDYGRYDLAQLRIKKGRMLGENFYIRGDGTRVYFFDAGDLSEMLTGSRTAFKPQEETTTTTEIVDDGEGTATGFTIDERSGVKLEHGKPPSTRFVHPEVDPKDYIPRVDYPFHETPTIEGESGEQQERIDPFVTPHEELGLPPNPLFRIEQLGVDRRLVRRDTGLFVTQGSFADGHSADGQPQRAN